MSMPLQQIKHLTVELMAVPVFVFYIATAGVENPELAPEIPQGVPDAVVGQDVEDVAEPGKKDIVRRANPVM